MFTKLIADLKGLADGQQADLSKSQTGDQDDANIQAAGATGGDSGDGGEGAAGAAAGADGAAGAEGGAEGEDGELTKSFEVTLEGGKKFQAMDATDLLKSLDARIGGIESAAGEALGLCVDMIKSLVADNADMHAQLAKLAGTGRGRQAVLTVVQKNTPAAGSSTLTKSEDKGMTPQEFLIKSEQAFDAGKLPGRDLALIESHINRREAIPAHLIQKVVGAASA